jgi:succinate-semialdehyde dehydrogenase/glutarate-semialdehyde dehydrogenase
MMTDFEGPLAQSIALCRQAQRDWKAQPWKVRTTILKRVSDLLVLRADDLSVMISRNCGKTLTDALSTEVVPATMALAWYCRQARRALASRRAPRGNLLLANKRSRIHNQPYGVIGIISPWNYPFAIPFSEVVMALLAGNGVVLKVATVTGGIGRAIAALFADAGLPKDLLVLSELVGSEAGPAMVKGGVDKLFFTGSVEVGRILMKEAAPRLLPLVLELGGNDAAVVRADANLDLAVRGLIWAGLSNAGQSCGGVQRILVHLSIFDDFCRRLARQVAELRVGDPENFDIDIGAMVNAAQKMTVEGQVRDAQDRGARLLLDLAPDPADAEGRTWMLPRILIDVSPASPVWTEEVFGPVMIVLPFETDDQAVEMANDSTMGLTSSVWSKNHKEARDLARRLRAGAVMVNDHLMSHGLAETPWGGFGHSGTGRTHGLQGLREMVREQVIVDDNLPLRRRNPWWHPHSRAVYDELKALQAFQYAPKIGRRLASVPKLLRLFFTYWKK